MTVGSGKLPLLDEETLTFPERFWPQSLAQDAEDARGAATSAGVSAASAAAPIATEAWDGAETLDAVPGGLVRVTLEGDTTVTLPSLDADTAVSMILRVEQDETGGHNLLFSGALVAEGVAYEPTQDAGAIDFVTLLWDGTAWTAFAGATNVLIPMGWVI